MNDQSLSSCSIIILNFFGERVIERTVKSLLSLNYPKEKYEIIIIDNNSQDKSREIIQRMVKQNKRNSLTKNSIKCLFLEKNLGFARGNNEGIKLASGKYVILLNNDCIVDKNWLRELVKVAEKDDSIFAVNSKVLLHPKYFNTEIKINNNLILNEIKLIKSGLCKLNMGKPIQLTISDDDKKNKLECPFDPNDKVIKIKLNFEINEKMNYKKIKALEFVDLKRDSYQVKFLKENKGQLICHVIIDLNQVIVDSFEKVQNAGIMIFQDGSGRDIGSCVSYHKQNYERDYGQFSEEKEIYAACGAAVLYRNDVFKKIGYLEGSFFMYYEDDEISERARLHGYKIFFCPKAVVRHIHAFTSVEWSNFFIYHAEKGRLIHTFFHFPLRIFIKEYLVMIGYTVDVTFKLIKALASPGRCQEYLMSIIWTIMKKTGTEEKQRKDLGKAVQYIKIIVYFLIHFPSLLLARRIKHLGVSRRIIEKNYQEILSGQWYFD